MKHSPDAMLILSHLSIQNANTISSPLTWGFPAISAILGFTHALERKLKLKAKHFDLTFDGVGIICHSFIPQVFKPKQKNNALLCLTKNPIATRKQLQKFCKEGALPSFAEEGRAHMEISLIIPTYYAENCIINREQAKYIAKEIYTIAQTLRLAGGSIMPKKKENLINAQLISWSTEYEDQLKESKKILRQLIPGFVLISREKLLADRAMELQSVNSQATTLDALLEFSSLNYESIHNPEKDETLWIQRKNPGWLVPIPVGYSAISELYASGTVLNARNTNYPFQFVENIYSLGEWRSPHRIKNIEHILWHYAVDIEHGLYQCTNNPKDSINI